MKRVNAVNKIFAFLMISVMLISSVGGINAKAAGNLLVPAKATGRFDFNIEPGEMKHYLIPVKAADAALSIFSLSGESASSELVISNVKISDPRSTVEPDYSNGFFLQHGSVYNLEFDITASDALKIGYNTVSISGSGHAYYSDGDIADLNNDLLMTLTSYTSKELKPIEIVIDKTIYNEEDVYPGNSLTMKLKLKNAGERQALNTYLSMSFGSSGIIPDYKVENISVGTINPGESKAVEVPVKVLKNAQPGFYDITATITCKDTAGAAEGPFSHNLYVTVNKPDAEEEKTGTPIISLSTPDNYTVLNPDTEALIKVILKNTGDEDATDVKLNVTSGLDASIGLTKGFTSDSIAVGTIKAGKEAAVEVPVRVAKSFGAGLYELQMNASFKDSKNNDKTSANMTMYVKGAQQNDEKGGASSVSIGNVSQYPESPKAGEKVTVSFDIINDGKTDITNVKVSGSGLSASGFEPVTSEPYKKVGTVKANSKTRVSMTFKVGKNIPEGFNTLGIDCDYTNSDGTSGNETAGLYILNVINDISEKNEQKISRPKLIISDYSTEPIIDLDLVGEEEDIEKLQKELRAGGIFDFKYDLKNTHATKAAKNIKITLEQVEGIFSPTEGSNIFYIDQIAAGETAQQVIRLKTRSDVATGDYSVSIRVEYEYDDMSEIDTEKGGVVDENNIKLHAVENYRPEIENIFIDAYEGVQLGVPVDLSFEFYNMGRSTLGNVYVTIEGDFELANNSSKTYVGAVSGYGQEYVNPQIVPLVAGEAVGTVVVHFEDSNGDEQIKTADFTTFVMGGEGDYGDFGFPDYSQYENMSGSFYQPDFDYGEEEWGDMETEDGEKTTILGLAPWLFAVICAAVVVIIVVIIIVVVKKKHKKALLDEDDE